MGVYQLADSSGEVCYIGFAGGLSLQGLRCEVVERAAALPGVSHYRVEVTTAYQTRFRELLMVHIADHGEYPQHNDEIKLGRLNPS